jgi:spore germination protein KC
MTDEKKFEDKLERYFKEQMESVLNNLQKQKTDALGIGHKLYLRHPSRWKKIKPDWPERYAQIPADIRVKVTISNSKMMNPSPFVQVGED